MNTFIIILIVIVALLLGLIVLIQNPKGGGLAVGFQGASQIGGVQRTTDFLEKATWYLVAALFALSLISSIWFTQKEATGGADTISTQQTDGSGGGTDNNDGSAPNPQ
ncbi:MAG: preprotein translocase subunit SecG [Crocinitomicaceae bacterium]|nr:preprotein translocase subunit SecG [Crocinitomicaceae bacterium]